MTEQFTKPGTANVSPADRKKLAPLIKHYMAKPHPFASCKRDQMKHGLTEDHANRRCAVIKDIGTGTTKWRKGNQTLAQEDWSRAGTLLLSFTDQELADWYDDEGLEPPGALSLNLALEQLQLAIFRWNPSDHPRDLWGKFMDVVDNLNDGDSVDMPDGINVRREGITYFVKGQPFDTPGNAAEAALDFSARSAHPRSVGGKKKYPDLDDVDPDSIRGRHPLSSGVGVPMFADQTIDEEAFLLALSAERVTLGLDPDTGYLTQTVNGEKVLFMTIFDWDPKLHPRNLLGRFRETVDALQPGDSINLPDGTRVRRDKKTSRFVIKPSLYSKKQSIQDDAMAAAEDALNISAESTHPASLGGTKSHQYYEHATQADPRVESIETNRAIAEAHPAPREPHTQRQMESDRAQNARDVASAVGPEDAFETFDDNPDPAAVRNAMERMRPYDFITVAGNEKKDIPGPWTIEKRDDGFAIMGPTGHSHATGLDESAVLSDEMLNLEPEFGVGDMVRHRDSPDMTDQIGKIVHKDPEHPYKVDMVAPGPEGVGLERIEGANTGDLVYAMADPPTGIDEHAETAEFLSTREGLAQHVEDYNGETWGEAPENSLRYEKTVDKGDELVHYGEPQKRQYEAVAEAKKMADEHRTRHGLPNHSMDVIAGSTKEGKKFKPFIAVRKTTPLSDVHGWDIEDTQGDGTVFYLTNEDGQEVDVTVLGDKFEVSEDYGDSSRSTTVGSVNQLQEVLDDWTKTQLDETPEAEGFTRESRQAMEEEDYPDYLDRVGADNAESGKEATADDYSKAAGKIRRGETDPGFADYLERVGEDYADSGADATAEDYYEMARQLRADTEDQVQNAMAGFKGSDKATTEGVHYRLQKYLDYVDDPFDDDLNPQTFEEITQQMEGQPGIKEVAPFGDIVVLDNGDVVHLSWDEEVGYHVMSLDAGSSEAADMLKEIEQQKKEV